MFLKGTEIYNSTIPMLWFFFHTFISSRLGGPVQTENIVRTLLLLQ